MKNILDEHESHLVQVDYTPLLTSILRLLRDMHTFPLSFQEENKQLILDLDEASREIARHYTMHPVADPNAWGKVLSVYFGPPQKREAFQQQIADIKKEIERLFRESFAHGRSLQDTASVLLQPLLSFAEKTAPQGLRYEPLKTPGKDLSSQRLLIEKQAPSGKEPLFQGHVVRIAVKHTQQFLQELGDGVMRHVSSKLASASLSQYSEEDRQGLEKRVRERLTEDTSDLYRLAKVVSLESFGKLKQEASIAYLEMLAKRAGSDPAGHLIHNLAKRLRALKAYLLAHPDGTYRISYAGVVVDLRDLFAPSHSFNLLPIIPLIGGILGATVNGTQGEISYFFGVKLKLNYGVSAFRSPSVLDYYVDQMDPTSEIHQSHLTDAEESEAADTAFKQRVLHITCLYAFVLYKLDDDQHDPATSSYWKTVLKYLQGDDEEGKKALLKKMGMHFRDRSLREPLLQLRKLLQKLVAQRTFVSEPHDVHIGVRTSILSDIHRMFRENLFLKEEDARYERNLLKYVTVSAPQMSGTDLCKMPASIFFEAMYYFTVPGKDYYQTFGLRYHVEPFDVLPILFTPIGNAQGAAVAEKMFSRPLLHIPYRLSLGKTTSASQRFAYKFTFAILMQTSLVVLLQMLNPFLNQDRQLFLPFIRLHGAPKELKREEEHFLKALAKVSAHLLSETHLATSQGFNMKELAMPSQEGALPSRLQNGLSSLLAPLPKDFLFHAPTLNSQIQPLPSSGLEKMALVVVSSRKSDSKSRHDVSLTTIYGEVTCIDWMTREQVRIKRIPGFTDICIQHESRAEIPAVLIEAIHRCYEQGYRHIFYIAKSPYTSTLHLTQEEKDEELYFMNERVLTAMKTNHPNLKLYPIFFDQYYVRKKAGLLPNSFLIPHVADLVKVMEDPERQTVAFFHLLNGFSVAKRDENYVGVTSYTTFLNRADGLLNDQDTWLGLLAGSESEPNPLKNDLLNGLLLYHFAHYERQPTLMLKLDPYEHIIGSESLGATAILPHSLKHTQWNLLAVLAETHQILSYSPPSQGTPPLSEKKPLKPEPDDPVSVSARAQRSGDSSQREREEGD